MQDLIKNRISEAAALLERIHLDAALQAKMQEIVQRMAQVLAGRGKIIIFGNGGSMADAMHFAEELTGRFKLDRPALAAIALSDPAFISCSANDFGYSEVFARGVEAYCHPDDLVIGISCSGDSPNVIKGLQKAQDLGAFSFALLGKDGGKLKGECDYEIIIDSPSTARIQEMHMMILHIMIEALEIELGFSN